MKEQKFRKLNIWKKAMDFVKKIYKATNNFPSKEIYGLTAQARRAATSIALNIAEGSGTSSDKEFSRFLSMALRSAYEVMCGIEIASMLKYCPKAEAEDLLKDSNELAAMISGLKNKLKAES